MITIYLLRHMASGRGYVGRTRLPLAQRVQAHVSAACIPSNGIIFHRALHAFGLAAFDAQEVERCFPEGAVAAEAAAIERLGTRWPAGFNLRPCSSNFAVQSRREAIAEFPFIYTGRRRR